MEFIFPLFVFSISLLLHSSIYIAPVQLENPLKHIPLVSASGYGFFGTVTKAMMTAMMKSSNSNSDSDDSESPPPPNFKSPLKKIHPLLLITIYILILLIISLLVFHIQIILLPLSKPFLTTLLISFPYTMYGNQLKFTLLLYHLLNVMTSH